MAPDKLGDTYSKTSMVTPLSARPGKADPGPPLLNNPVESPNDPLNFLKVPQAKKNGKGDKSS